MKTHKQYLVTTCALADVGRVRSQQQDSLGYVTLPHDRKSAHWGHLYVVADGVGGAEAGGLASALAVQTMIDECYQHPFSNIEEGLLKAISQANQKILQEGEKRHIHRMHTTVVCATIHGQQLYVAHVGDSRAYLMRSGKLERLTKDHSEAQTLIDAKKLTEEEARTYPGRNLITRALGYESDVEPDISRHDIRPNDLLLLCSDGLHGELRDEEIASILEANTDLNKTCQALVQQAKSSGGKDNISLILTRIGDVEEIGKLPKAKAFPLKPGEIRQFSHLTLAEPLSDSMPKPPLKKNWSQQQKRFLALLIIAIYFGLTVSMMLWLQTKSSQQQAELERSQQSLVEAEANLDALILDYGQHLDFELLQRLESVREELNIDAQQGDVSVVSQDIFHDAVKNALQKDGWTITHDPISIQIGDVGMKIDLGAKKLIAAEKGEEQIAVEIKSFIGSEAISEFHTAVGEYMNYRRALSLEEPEYRIYLAVPQQTYTSFFSLNFIQESVQDYQIKLIVYDVEEEVIIEWKK